MRFDIAHDNDEGDRAENARNAGHKKEFPQVPRPGGLLVWPALEPPIHPADD
jgi:hypothetical protein